MYSESYSRQISDKWREFLHPGRELQLRNGNAQHCSGQRHLLQLRNGNALHCSGQRHLLQYEMEMHCIAQYGAESTTTFQSLTLFYYVKSYSEWYRWAVSLNHCCHWQLTVVLIQSEKSYNFSPKYVSVYCTFNVYCKLSSETFFRIVFEIKLLVKNFVTSSHISGKSRKTLIGFEDCCFIKILLLASHVEFFPDNVCKICFSISTSGIKFKEIVWKYFHPCFICQVWKLVQLRRICKCSCFILNIFLSKFALFISLHFNLISLSRLRLPLHSFPNLGKF